MYILKSGTKKSIKGSPTNTALRVYNRPLGLSSMNPKTRLTKVGYKTLQLTHISLSILIGIMLGDGWLQQQKGENPRVAMKQSIVNFRYLWECFSQLAYLCSNIPYFSWSKLKGIRYLGITFQTRQLACLTAIRDLFYITGSKVKFISPNLYFYMNPTVLAHWIMCDGTKRQRGIVLCTDGFSYIDVVTLINILMLVFEIRPELFLHSGKPRIYIRGADMNKIRPLIAPHMSVHFIYKINHGVKRLT